MLTIRFDACMRQHCRTTMVSFSLHRNSEGQPVVPAHLNAVRDPSHKERLQTLPQRLLFSSQFATFPRIQKKIPRSRVGSSLLWYGTNTNTLVHPATITRDMVWYHRDSAMHSRTSFPMIHELSPVLVGGKFGERPGR